jgi:hypothetical protein
MDISDHKSGAWNGTGIISSTAQTHTNFGLGYANAADSGRRRKSRMIRIVIDHRAPFVAC